MESPIKKLFRFHAMGCTLADSLETVIEVDSISDLQEKINAALPYGMSRIQILPDLIPDDRLPHEWGGVSYYVIGNLNGHNAGVVGMSNFYEE